MTSLADQIADKQEQTPENPSIDELGIPIPTPETPEYWVARALKIHNPLNHTDIYQIHLRNNTLYLGHTPLKENEDTLYSLTHLRHSVKKWELAAFYRVLKQYAPKLNRNFLQIADNLYWDMQRGELIDKETVLERSKSGS